MSARYDLYLGHRLYSEWKATSYGAFATRWRIHLGLSVNASLHTNYQLLGQIAVPAHTLRCIPSRILSIGLGLIAGIAIHGAVSANTRTRRHTCVSVP